jgi:multidrug resistance protein MdtO
MATQATPFRYPPARPTVSWPWFREFLRWELAPYPGRINTVVRMTVTATLVMIIVVTFRIPNPFLAAFFSILMARENLGATWRGGQALVRGFVAASLYTVLGMMMFRGYPITHFFWVIGSLYLAFFVIGAANNYAAAVAFAVPIAVALPIWDRPSPSEDQVENTLWLIVVIAVGVGVTAVTEAVYRIFDRSDPLIGAVGDLLLPVQQAVENVARSRTPPMAIRDRILQYQMIGTGRLRLMLQRQGVDPTQRAQRSALISLTGRLVGLAANLIHTPPQPAEDDRNRLRALAKRLGSMRAELRGSGVISASPPALEGQPSSRFPMLQEMEQSLALLTEVFQPSEIVDDSRKAQTQPWWRTLFVPDAFQNPEHLRFALAGCLASSICYVLYNGLDWPGINTSVLTCIVTALTTIGASLQAQFVRLAGFVVGGLILGISAQILILPAIDSIFGFALFFAAATALAAWVATSSPRLSYFGVQMAISFYFVHLQGSEIQTDLTVARDKVIGVLLGILAMGFIFDRFGTKSDAQQLQKALVQNIRLLAQVAVCPMIGNKAAAVSKLNLLRSEINDNFASLTSQMDSVQFEFEFRQRRDENVFEWQRIETAQPALRSIYLLEYSLLSYRGRPEIASQLSQGQNHALDHFLIEYSNALTHIASQIEMKATKKEKVRLERIELEKIGHGGAGRQKHENVADEGIAREDAAPGSSDDSIRQFQQTFEPSASPSLQVIADICQKMATSLVMLRSRC